MFEFLWMCADMLLKAHPFSLSEADYLLVWRNNLDFNNYSFPNYVLLPFSLSPGGISSPLIFEGFDHPSYILMPFANSFGGMFRFVCIIPSKDHEKLGENQANA